MPWMGQYLAGPLCWLMDTLPAAVKVPTRHVLVRVRAHVLVHGAICVLVLACQGQ